MLPGGEFENKIGCWMDMPGVTQLELVELTFEWRLHPSTNGLEKMTGTQSERVARRFGRVLRIGVPLPPNAQPARTVPNKKRKFNALSLEAPRPSKEASHEKHMRKMEKDSDEGLHHTTLARSLGASAHTSHETDSDGSVDEVEQIDEHDVVRNMCAAPFDSSDMLLTTRAESKGEGGAVPPPSSPEEATRLLSNFRPSRNTPQTLATILNSRADPNIIAGDGAIPPLRNVTAFARNVHVREMRKLLLEAGAQEDDEARERWATRRRADAADKAWMENFHKDPDLVALVGE